MILSVALADNHRFQRVVLHIASRRVDRSVRIKICAAIDGVITSSIVGILTLETGLRMEEIPDILRKAQDMVLMAVPAICQFFPRPFRARVIPLGPWIMLYAC